MAEADFFINAKLRISDVDAGAVTKLITKIQNQKIAIKLTADPKQITRKLSGKKISITANIKPEGKFLRDNLQAELLKKTFSIKVKAQVEKRGIGGGGTSRPIGGGISQGITSRGAQDLSRTVDQLEQASKASKQLGKNIPIKAFKELERSGGSAGDRIANSLGIATGSAKSFGVTIGVVLRRFAAFAIASRILIGFQNTIGKAIRELRDFNQGLADLQKVSLEARKNISLFAAEQIGLARSFATTISFVQELQTEFARQGRSAQETGALTRAALLSINAAGLTATEALELLTITTNVFGISALKAGETISKLTSLADANAVTVQDMTEALRRSASVFAAINLSLEQSASLITIVREQTRLSPRQIGTGFKSIIPSIVKVEDRLKELGVSTRNALGEFDFTKTIKEINKLFEALPAARVIKLSTEFVGKRQSGKFIALVNGINDLEQDLALQAAAAGNAIEKQAIQFDTFNSRVQELNNSVFELVQTFASTGLEDFAKGGLTALTGLIDGFTSILNIAKSINLPVAGIAIAFLGITKVIPVIAQIVAGFSQFRKLISSARSASNTTAEAVNRIAESAFGIQAPLKLAGQASKDFNQSVKNGNIALKEEIVLLEKIVTQTQNAKNIRTKRSRDPKTGGFVKGGPVQLGVGAQTIANQTALNNLDEQIAAQNQLLNNTIKRVGVTNALKNAEVQAADARLRNFTIEKSRSIELIRLEEQKIQKIRQELDGLANLNQALAQRNITPRGRERVQQVIRAGDTAQFAGLEGKQRVNDLAKARRIERLTSQERIASVKKSGQLALSFAKRVRQDVTVGFRQAGKVLSSAAQKVIGILKKPLSGGGFLGVTIISGFLKEAVDDGKELDSTIEKVVGGVQNIALVAGALSFAGLALSFGATLGIALAVVAALKLISFLINPPKTGLEIALEKSQKEIGKSLKGLSSLRSKLSELANLAQDDISSRIKLTNELIDQDKSLIDFRTRLLSLSSDNLNNLKTDIGLKERGLKILELNLKRSTELFRIEKAISLARIPSFRAIALRGVEKGEGFVARERTDVNTSAEKLIKLEAELIGLTDRQVKKREEIEKQIDRINKRMTNTVALEQTILNLRLETVKTQEEKNKLNADAVFLQLKNAGLLGIIGRETLNEAGLLDDISNKNKGILTTQEKRLENRKKNNDISAKELKILEDKAESTRELIVLQQLRKEQLIEQRDALKEINKLFQKQKTILEQTRFEIGLQKVQNEIGFIINDIESLPKEIQTTITLGRDKTALNKELRGIEESLFAAIEVASKREILIKSGLDDGLINDISDFLATLATADVSVLRDQLANIESQLAKGKSDLKGIVGESKNLFKEKEKLEALEGKITKITFEQLKGLRSLVKENGKLKSDSLLIGINFNAIEKAQIAIIKTTVERARIEKEIQFTQAILEDSTSTQTRKQEAGLRLTQAKLSLDNINIKNVEKTNLALLQQEKIIRDITRKGKFNVVDRQVEGFKNLIKASQAAGQVFDPIQVATRENEIRKTAIDAEITLQKARINAISGGDKLAIAKRLQGLDELNKLEIRKAEDGIDGIKRLSTAQIQAANDIRSAGKKALGLFTGGRRERRVRDRRIRRGLELIRTSRETGQDLDPSKLSARNFESLNEAINAFTPSTKFLDISFSELSKEIELLTIRAAEVKFGVQITPGIEDSSQFVNALPERIEALNKIAEATQQKIGALQLEGVKRSQETANIIEGLLVKFKQSFQGIDIPIKRLEQALDTIPAVVQLQQQGQVDVNIDIGKQFITQLADELIKGTNQGIVQKIIGAFTELFGGDVGARAQSIVERENK